MEQCSPHAKRYTVFIHLPLSPPSNVWSDSDLGELTYNVCLCVYVTDIYLDSCVCVCVCVFIHVCEFVCVCVCVWNNTSVCVCVCKK